MRYRHALAALALAAAAVLSLAAAPPPAPTAPRAAPKTARDLARAAARLGLARPQLPARGADVTLRAVPLYYDDSSLAPADLTAACLLPAYPHYVVTDYGADPTGVADSTPAVRAALAAAKVNGSGIVYFPAGTYALCPQAGDPVTGPQPVLTVTGSNVVLLGEGAGTSVLKFYCLGMTDPLTHWRVTGDSYSKISRGGLINFDTKNNGGQPMAGLQVRSLTLDGQLPYTGNSTVGGDVNTGDGWDISHKALLCNGSIDKVLVVNCDVKNWRGEELYSGGNLAGAVTVANTWVHGSNASAISMSANVWCENVTVGGPNPGDDVYNGAENFATTPQQRSTFKNCVVQTGSASARGNGLTLIGVPGSTATVSGCAFTSCGHAVLASEVLYGFTFQANTISRCGGGIITSILGLYPKFPIGFGGWLVDGNTADAGGVFFNMQSHGPGPVDPLVLSNNSLTTTGALVAGGFGSVLPQKFQVTGNTLGVGTSDAKNQPYTGIRGVWSGTKRPAAPNLTGTMPAVNDYNATSTGTLVAPVTDAFCLNDVKNYTVPHYALFDPAALGVYPPGYTVTFYQGPSNRKWLVKADPATNTLATDMPVPAAGATLVFDGAKFNPKP